ncbi:hypothetical protein N7470_008227 [Penicillium chermesinum]|nr:hypothetical protein N7470_008227 [Penicillium chermesinum]
MADQDPQSPNPESATATPNKPRNKPPKLGKKSPAKQEQTPPPSEARPGRNLDLRGETRPPRRLSPNKSPSLSPSRNKNLVAVDAQDLIPAVKSQTSNQLPAAIWPTNHSSASALAAPRQPQQQQGQDGGPLGGLGGVDQAGQLVQNTAGNALNGVTGSAGKAVGGVLGGGQEEKGDDGGRDEQLRLRLDLNLDIEIQLKAKIHGDLTLGLLSVPPFLFTPPLFPNFLFFKS